MEQLEISADLWQRWQAVNGREEGPRVHAIADFLVHELDRRQMRPGDRLPSVRELATLCGCSHDTSARALDELVTAGRIEARRGSGFFVTRSLRREVAAIGIDVETGPALALSDDRWLLSTHIPVARRPGSGIIHPDLAPTEEIARAARSALRIRAGVFNDYNIPAGYRPLRVELLRVLHSEGIACTIDEIMTGAGATGVLAILIRALVRPGDHVLIEDPSSFLHRDLLMSQGATIDWVTRDAGGPDIEQLRRLCKARPRTMFLFSSRVQNPTGWSISPERAHELKRVSDEFGLMIVDDDSHAELRPDQQRPSLCLRALGRSDKIVHVSSLTRVVAPGMSVGYLVASGPVMKSVLLFKGVHFGAGSILPERIFYHFLAEGRYRRVIRALRRRIVERRDLTLRALQNRGFNPDEQGDGLYLWLPVSASPLDDHYVRAMLDAGYLVAAGRHFSHAPGARCFSRLNVTVCDTEFLGVLQRSSLGT